MQTRQQSKQTGSALLTALFVMTLVAIAATAMTLRLKVDITKAQISIKASRLKNKAQLATFMGMQWLLLTQLPKSKQQQNPAVLVRFSKLVNDANWHVSGKVIDLQSRYNINNVKNIQNLKPIQTLLINNGVDQSESKKIVKLCRYWTQPHRLGQGNDPLLEAFLAQKPPYYPGFQAFISPSELRLIPGITSTIANKIMPFIISLPSPTPVNIATAPPEVLSILGDGLTDSQVKRILKLRNDGQIENKQKLNELLRQNNIPSNQVTLQSNYFLIVSTVRHVDDRIQKFTIVERKKSKNKKQVGLHIVFVSYHTL